MLPTKIVIIGAGSASFGLNTVGALLRSERLRGSHIALVDRNAEALAPIAHLAQRKTVMRLFDALILNVDRRQENWLVDRDSFDLYLIDHSRSFRDRKTLPPEFSQQLTRISRQLYDKLAALDEERITKILDELISRQQIRALMARRDLILEKIDEDLREYGPEVVFIDGHQTRAATVASSKLD